MNYQIKEGELIIFPTDTVYGLACLFHDYSGFEKIFELKNRDLNKKMAVLCADISQVEELVVLSEAAYKLSFFWPGALTLILPLKETHPYYDKSLGVRIPANPLASKILLVNGPLATTSVNLSGEKEINDYLEIEKNYGNKVSKIFGNEDILSGVSSTIVDLTQTPFKIIREGEIKAKDIEAILKK